MSGFIKIALYVKVTVCYTHIGGKHKGSFSAYTEDVSKTYFSIPDGEWFTYKPPDTGVC